MKKFPLLILPFCTLGICIAQPGEWVWLHGPSAIDQPGIFGVMGISAPSNNPPSLYEACEWTDPNGIFWMYGGLSVSYNEFGDMWKYDPSINEWTWMNGTGLSNAPPNYGTLGVPSPTNTPGARAWGMASWIDNQGNFWMFGGSESGNIFSDLWRYEPSTNNWTWMKGPQGSGSAGVYGIQGVPNPANFPAGRYETSATWVDINNDLWLFGGYNMVACRNDLWRYNIASNEWTWMKGSNMTGAPDVYGVQGVENIANTPGGRTSYGHWKDLNGNFWLFGGTNISGTYYNDLWRYNPGTNNWAWFKGGSTNEHYGTQCISDSLNIPGVRFESRACATDANGDFWLFGGIGFASSDTYNDLWKYCVSSNKWTWISGDNQPNSFGNWGTIGVSSPLNVPNARGGNVMWVDQSGHIYLFGGTNNGWPDTYSDLWKFTIDPSCATCSTQPVALFNAPNQICPGTCTDFTNTSVNSTSFIWSFPGGNPSLSTDANPSGICYAATGTYDVTLIASNGATSDTLTLANFITVFPTPPPQGILQNGDTLFANQGAVSYQWFENGNIIPGATNYFYIALESGNYNLVATDSNECEVEAVIFDVIAGISQFSVSNSQLAIYPNPVKDNLEIRYSNASADFKIRIYNNIGERVLEKIEKNFSENISLDVSSYSAGTYFLELSDGINSFRKIFTKQ